MWPSDASQTLGGIHTDADVDFVSQERGLKCCISDKVPDDTRLLDFRCCWNCTLEKRVGLLSRQVRKKKKNPRTYRLTKQEKRRQIEE